jgi:hypothetical protein
MHDFGEDFRRDRFRPGYGMSDRALEYAGVGVPAPFMQQEVAYADAMARDAYQATADATAGITPPPMTGPDGMPIVSPPVPPAFLPGGFPGREDWRRREEWRRRDPLIHGDFGAAHAARGMKKKRSGGGPSKGSAVARLVALAGAGGAIGHFAIGGPLAVLGGVVLGGVVDEVVARVQAK